MAAAATAPVGTWCSMMPREWECSRPTGELLPALSVSLGPLKSDTEPDWSRMDDRPMLMNSSPSARAEPASASLPSAEDALDDGMEAVEAVLPSRPELADDIAGEVGCFAIALCEDTGTTEPIFAPPSMPWMYCAVDSDTPGGRPSSIHRCRRAAALRLRSSRLLVRDDFMGFHVACRRACVSAAIRLRLTRVDGTFLALPR